MAQEEYPKEITKENLPQLVKRAKKIKRKGNIVLFVTSLIYGAVSWLAGPVLLFLSGQLVIVSYTPETMPSSIELTIAIVITFFVLYLAFLFFFLWFLEYIGRRVAKLRYSELVFYEAVLIVNCLNQGNRTDAVKEVDGFISSLLIYQSPAGRDSRVMRYAPEIKTLKVGKSQVKRMLLFSTENISELFASFGLAFINSDDPTAYRYLQYILSEARKYGKLEGWLDKIRGQVTTLQIILVSISIAIGIAVSVATILSLLGII